MLCFPLSILALLTFKYLWIDQTPKGKLMQITVWKTVSNATSPYAMMTGNLQAMMVIAYGFGYFFELASLLEQDSAFFLKLVSLLEVRSKSDRKGHRKRM